MIRQHVQRLQIIQTADKVTQLPQIVVVQRDARHDHVADPDRNALFLEVLGEFQDVPVALLGEFLVFCIVNVLDVQHDQIGHCHEPVEFRAAFLTEQNAGGVQTGIDTLFLCRLKQFR